jgi:hypothetical protein
MEEKQVRNQVGPHLIVNRAEVISEGCQACGQGFAAGPAGDRALTAIVGVDKNAYMFCAACGDAIMGHVQADVVRQRYAWDWVIPVKGSPLSNKASGPAVVTLTNGSAVPTASTAATK